MLVFLFLFLVLTIVPIFWVQYIFKKNDKVISDMPFNGFEFGQELLRELNLSNVKIEETKLADHYDLEEKKVKILDSRLQKKSLTAISIICHEIGHAIQHSENYAPLETRTKIVKNTQWINKFSMSLIYVVLPLVVSFGAFPLIKILLPLILLSLIIGIVIHLITLEVELDASFNKAYPIMKLKIPVIYHSQCKSILRAAAFTYVVGVIRNFLSLRILWTLLSRIK
tara:strand:+ start:930 stop:1607 length:678 start_codon:yes stop_codon:yes gene_type:complete